MTMRPRSPELRARTLLSVALAGALAAGCAIRPDYKRPVIESPAAFRGTESTPSSFADLAWWQVYRDAELEALLRRGLERNRDVRIAAARIAEARANLGVADYAWLPQVGVNAATSRSRVSSVGSTPIPANAGTARRQYRATIDASYEIDFWGRLASLTEAARADLLALEAGRDVVYSTLVGDIASAWFDLLGLDQQLAISLRTIETRQRFLELTELRLKAGTATRLDVDRARANLAVVRATIPDIRRRIELNENLLRVLTGDAPGPLARQRPLPEGLPAAPDVPPGLPSQLLERRPDLRQAEQAIIAANARVAAQRAALLPTFSLTGSLGSDSGSVSSFLTDPSKVWSLGGSLFAPLINAQRNRFAVDALQAREVQALEQYQKVVEGSLREVADAIVGRREFSETAQAQGDQVRALRDVERVVVRRYEAGLSSYFEVVDAQRDLFQAELSLAQSQRNVLVATVQLYKALGGGWQRPTPVASSESTGTVAGDATATATRAAGATR